MSELEYIHTSDNDTVEDDELLGEIYTFQFSKGDRGIDFLFGIEDHEVTVYINNLSKQQQTDDYDEDTNSFSLENWLRKNNQLSGKWSFCIDSYEGNISEKMQHFFSFLKTAFQAEQLKKIIDGETWDYVPFDWGDMK